MPYLHCPACRLTIYSAALHSTVDHCPRCEARLGLRNKLFETPRLPRLTATNGSKNARGRVAPAGDQRLLAEISQLKHLFAARDSLLKPPMATLARDEDEREGRAP